ncbi:MAG TPA: Fic family protein [Alphaproteobacteria bacterium]|nr:Fic family protein [Alphaproteobacteria bacterium]
MFQPNFQISPRLSKALMETEACRQAVSDLPITVTLLDSLRKSARLVSTHYSTQIEGNRLTQQQVQEVVLQGGTFPNRERDEQEVRNYYRALDYVDFLINDGGELTEGQVRSLHELVMTGKEKPTPYRDGQNVIRDSASSSIVYMPPEAKDVPKLMTELFTWLSSERTSRDLPAPVMAGLAHYQFATVHPYYDGNGRTARLLTNLLLHQAGYGLKGIYSLEEYYALDLGEYYKALSVGPSHNYYMGRESADLSRWLEYFCLGMADAFSAVRARAVEEAKKQKPDQAKTLKKLDARQRQALMLFESEPYITTKQIADHLGIHRRTALNLCNSWVKSGFLIQYGEARKSRKYGLASEGG